MDPKFRRFRDRWEFAFDVALVIACIALLYVVIRAVSS